MSNSFIYLLRSVRWTLPASSPPNNHYSPCHPSPIKMNPNITQVSQAGSTAPEIPLFEDFTLTKGPSARISVTMCGICHEDIDPQAHTVTHDKCGNTWCQECFVAWTKSAPRDEDCLDEYASCPLCRRQGDKMAMPGALDELTGQVVLHYGSSRIFQVVGSIQEARRRLFGLTGLDTIEVFICRYVSYFMDLLEYEKLNVQARVPTARLLRDRHILHLRREDIYQIWYFSTILGVTGCVQYEIQHRLGYTFFIPDLPMFTINMARTLDSTNSGLEHVSLAWRLHIPLPASHVRAFIRASDVQSWDFFDYDHLIEDAEHEVTELDEVIDGDVRNLNWSLLATQETSENPLHTTGHRLLVIPYPEPRHVVGLKCYQKLFGLLCSGERLHLRQAMGWTEELESAMLKAFLTELEFERANGGYSMPSSDSEKLEWWGRHPNL
jgi:hypothetical protein